MWGGVVKLVVAGLLLIALFSGSVTPVSASDFDSSVKSIVSPHVFSIAAWELRNIPHLLGQWILGRPDAAGDEVETVVEYFSLIDRIGALQSAIEGIRNGNGHGDLSSLEAELNVAEKQKEALNGSVETILARQIRQVLAEEGIYNPFVELRIPFPPMSFKLDSPPRLLVISPRDSIECVKQVTLQQDLTPEQIEDIESEVDELGVSSLVVELGGFGGTYPAFVVNNANLRFTVDTAAEEWLHQYLAFEPLGFRYLLHVTGVHADCDVATLNETLVGIVSKEIGAKVMEEFYSQDEEEGQPPAESGFNFNREMREIRKAVDSYLAQGQIEEAEKFMEAKRQYLASEGYYIRKLNQAYFAFHGTYGESPASTSPIGAELNKLKIESASLKDFLDTVANMTSHQDLISMVQ